MNTQFPAWPAFEDKDISAVVDCLRSGKVNYWTGNKIRDFERAFGNFCQVEHCIALANGTVALEVLLRAMEISSGDEVIVTPRSFVASASCVMNVGATPVFADVERKSGNLSAETIQSKISARTKCIIVVHTSGLVCDMDPIMQLAKEHGILVVEDCAQSHGSLYKGKPVGSIGHAAAFSFCQDKIITTAGEGGAVTTNNTELWKTVWEYKDHGRNYIKANTKGSTPGYRWLIDSLGTNLRMSELHAAVGLSMLERIGANIEARQRNAGILDACFKQFDGVNILRGAEGSVPSPYKYYITVDPSSLKPGWDRDKLISSISDMGFPCQQGTCCELYKEKVFSIPETDFELKNARYLAENSVMFFVHPTIDARMMTNYVTGIQQVFGSALK